MNKFEEIRKLNQELETARLERDHRKEDYFQEIKSKLESKKEDIIYCIDSALFFKKHYRYIQKKEDNLWFGHNCINRISANIDSITMSYRDKYDSNSLKINNDLSITVNNSPFNPTAQYKLLPMLNYLVDSIDNLKEIIDEVLDDMILETKTAIENVNNE